MTELPKGWITVRIPEVCELNPPKLNSNLVQAENPVTFVPMAAVNAQSGIIESPTIRPFREVSKGFTSFKENDVIMAKITPCMENGKAAIARRLNNGLGFGSTEFHVFRPTSAILSEYIFNFIRQESFRNLAEASMTGSVGQKRVPASFLANFEIPLPPFNEQRRIVKKLEKLLGKVGACQKRLERIPFILKRFRQSVLNSAITGRLTADWRADYQSLYSAQEDLKVFFDKKQLLDRINTRIEPIEGTELLAESVPTSWETPLLGDLFLFVDYRGKNPEKSHQGKRLITAKNIKMGYLSDAPVEFVSDTTYRQWMIRGLPKQGDIFFVTEGATMGFVALNTREDEFALAQRTITLQPFHRVDTKVFLYFMMSSLFQELVKHNATGSAAVGIKATRFRGLPIAFPPIAEQQVIIRRVEQLFRVADQIETRYNKAKAYVDKLVQSILAKAFRGELVPQDPNDEPASALLERIRAERAASEPANKKARPLSKKKQASLFDEA